MKNFIIYYYDLSIKNFKKYNDRFNFQIDNNDYTFMPIQEDFNRIYEIYMLLRQNNAYCHEILLNRDGNMVTYYENKPYILIKKQVIFLNIIKLEHIIKYDYRLYTNIQIKWKKLWESKIDYYEYQINQFGNKYKKIKDSFNYYIGLCELAIALLNYLENKECEAYICHKRIELKDKEDFFNPINMVIDNYTRDIAEYIKINFMNETLDINNIENFLINYNFTRDETVLLISRLLYPSYYFDIYDRIIKKETDEDKIEVYIKKSFQYEMFLRKTYSILKTKYKLPEIDWLEFNQY